MIQSGEKKKVYFILILSPITLIYRLDTAFIFIKRVFRAALDLQYHLTF